MGVVIEDITINDEFSSPNGIGFLNGGVVNKMVATIEFHCLRSTLGLFLRFTDTTKTAEIIDELDFRSFIEEGYVVGMTVSFDNAPLNPGPFTIASVEAQVLTFVEAVVDEELEGVDLFDDTPVTALDFYFNLIENKSRETYLSLVDRNAIQRFIPSADIDASDLTPVNMKVASESFGWNTNNITNEATGETDEVTIEGVAITDHKQRFKIIHTFFVAPYVTAGQLNDMINNVPPDYFQGENALKYIFRLDAKADASDTEPIHTGGDSSTNGRACWYDQNNIRTRAEYYFESISFFDADANELDSLDIDKEVDVEITIKSRTGLFMTASPRNVALDFIYLPLNESRYINTPNTTMRQNFLQDRGFIAVGTPGDGEYVGTAYQVLLDITPTEPDADTMVLNFKVNFSNEIRDFFKTLPEENRNFYFVVTTQQPDYTTAKQTERVAIKTPINQIAWDRTDDSLITAVDNIRVFHFPQINSNNYFTSVAGYEGDPVYVQFPFRLLITSGGLSTGATIGRAGFQIIARKADRDDFVLEEKIFDASFERKLDDKQTINISEEKGFVGLPDEYNLSFLMSDSSFDDGFNKGFVAHHAFLLRYDFWAKLIADNERELYDIFKDIESPTEAWNTVQQDGWELKLRFVVETSHNGIVQTDEQFWDIDCKALGDAPDAGPSFEIERIFRTEETVDEESVVVDSILEEEKTLIEHVFTADDFSVFPGEFNSFYGYVFADIEGQGGPQQRKFCSTEFDSEEDSPFTAPAWDGQGDITWASKNLRITIFEGEKIVLSTLYDDKKDLWSRRTKQIIFFPRLGYMVGCWLLDSEGEYVWDAIGQRIGINCDTPNASS